MGTGIGDGAPRNGCATPTGCDTHSNGIVGAQPAQVADSGVFCTGNKPCVPLTLLCAKTNGDNAILGVLRSLTVCNPYLPNHGENDGNALVEAWPFPAMAVKLDHKCQSR